MTASGVGSNVALYATETTSINTAGSHTVTAVYSGDNSYQGSTSAPATFKALYPVTISVTENSTNINYGQSLTITAKVTSSGKNARDERAIAILRKYRDYRSPSPLHWVSMRAETKC